MQEIVSNFISGLILLFERPIRIGDLVTVGDVTGNVQRINIRSTTIQNFDRQQVIVPNRSLITQDVTNWTLSDKMSRLTVKIGVAYGSSIDLVRSLLFEIAKKEQKVLEDPEPQVFFMSHGDSSLDFELRVFLADSGDRLVMLDRLNSEINRALEEHGIEIPFPQRDIHIRSQTAPNEPASDREEPDDDDSRESDEETRGSDHETRGGATRGAW
ncbi:MAG: mechanosensitive ion channel [Planctomycetota bacterium]